MTVWNISPDRLAGMAHLTTPVTTVISTQNVWVDVEGTFTLDAASQGFSLNASNELVFEGWYPSLVDLKVAFTIDTGNNQELGFRASKNGVGIAETETVIATGGGAGSAPRNGAVVALVDVVNGDRLGLQVANLDGTDDVDWLTATKVATA